MADIIPSKANGQKPGQRSARLSTRVDLTPMVDLGFLLITFFIFTTTLSEANGLKLNLPTDKPAIPPTKSPEFKTLNFILGNDNKVIAYTGTNKSEAVLTNYSNMGIREIINTKRNALFQQFKKTDDMVVLIKPTKHATYQNVVDVLDEMTIGHVTRYVLMEPDEGDEQLHPPY